MNSFIDVTYSRGTNKVTLTPQYQYNNGQKLRIKNINDDVSVTVHYAVRGMVKPIARIAEKTNDVWISAIPNVLMAQKSPVQAFVYLVTSDTAQTVFEVEIPILERPMPDGYEIDDEEINNIELMIEDLKKTIVKAESIANITASAKTLPSGSNATAAVTETNGQKELEFGIPMGADGKPGGYYSPVISDDGMLSWTASDDTLPPINNQKSIIGPEGKQGNSGVFYGPEEPTDPEVMVWIDEDGAADAPVSGGGSGATFIPSVSEDGTISWTNNGGLANPSPVNIKGPQGEPGKDAPQNAYTPDNQPPYPVTSVAGKTGDVKLTPEDIGAQPTGDYALKSEVPAAYTLPAATADTLGGVKSSEAVTVNADGTITVNQLNGKDADQYMLKTDTAADSLKLNGKDAAYYLGARNLLDNSDFTNPVNQRGQTSYMGLWIYSIDRWVYSGTDNALGLEDGYVNLPPGGRLIQPTALNKTKAIGKNYIFATSCVGWTEIPVAVGSILEADGTHFERASYGLNLRLYSVQESEYLYVDITNNSGYWTGVYWAALYEGEYTADNLPPYVPKGYAVELAECQRYYYKLDSGNYLLFRIRNMHEINGYSAFEICPPIIFPQTMREKPTVEISYDINDGENAIGTPFDWNDKYCIMPNVNVPAGSWFDCNYVIASADL